MVLIILFIVICGIVAQFVPHPADSQKTNTSTKNPQEETQFSEEETKIPAEILHKERIGRYFNSDGSHGGLTAFIKKNMNDPDSYKHVETKYIEKDDHLIVKTTFRGKNAFGAVVLNQVMAEVDLNGNVIEVIATGP